MEERIIDVSTSAPEHQGRGGYRSALIGALGTFMDPPEPSASAPLDNDCRLPVDPISGGNRESCESSNTHECAFGISEMTDDKTIR
jgi:hypothetical protein